jgi:hypothetical protein
MSVDDERLMAYLDGELGAAERSQVEAAIELDGSLNARLETQRRLRDRLASHYGPVAAEAVPVRFRQMLDPPVIDLAEARPKRAPARLIWRSITALAATLVFGLVLGTQIRRETGPVRSEHGALYADGDLARQLDTQLASAPMVGASMRVGVTFSRADGRYCRTFHGPALGGLACRDGEQWRLVVTAPGAGESQAEYRQASTGNALVLEAAQELMAGEPLDSAGERRARDSGWQRN